MPPRTARSISSRTLSLLRGWQGERVARSGATYALTGVAAASLLVFISMPFLALRSRSCTESTSLLGGGAVGPRSSSPALPANVGVGVACWLTNQKWAFISVGAGSPALSRRSRPANDNDLIDFDRLHLFPSCLQAGVILLPRAEGRQGRPSEHGPRHAGTSSASRASRPTLRKARLPGPAQYPGQSLPCAPTSRASSSTRQQAYPASVIVRRAAAAGSVRS